MTTLGRAGPLNVVGEITCLVALPEPAQAYGRGMGEVTA